MDYNSLRHLADSWGLVAMFAFFIAMAIFIFRPGSKKQYDEAARIPLHDGSED